MNVSGSVIWDIRCSGSPCWLDFGWPPYFSMFLEVNLALRQRSAELLDSPQGDLRLPKPDFSEGPHLGKVFDRCIGNSGVSQV